MRSRGFTLLEVIIALAIVALSVGALLGSVTSSASNIIYLKDKTLAEWVALNRLAEIRISKQMPILGKRTGEMVMGGMKWQWEQEVIELPVKGMFRIDVRSRPTGQAVDDSKPTTDRPTAQTENEGKSSGGEMEKLSWTTAVTGVIGSARSDLTTPIAINYAGSPLSGGPNNPNNPGNNPNNPGSPGNPGNPGSPGSPGSPGNPGSPGSPGNPGSSSGGSGPKPPPQDR
jgi:type II secretion system protein I